MSLGSDPRTTGGNVSERVPPSPNPFVAKMEPYRIVPQEIWQAKNRRLFLKLDWNESTVLNGMLHRKMVDMLSEPELIFWYPDVNCTKVSASLADYLSITPPEILVFAGSDEALAAICTTYLQPNDRVCVVNPSYDNFRIYAERLGAILMRVCLEDPFHFDVEEFIRNVRRSPEIPKLIYLVSPNNPIGYEIDLKDTERVLEEFPDSMVIVDEAYVEFSGNTCCLLIRKHPNLVVVRTFSKAFGLAGLRIGYTVSDIRNHSHLGKVRNGKNVTMLAQQAASLLIESLDDINKHIHEVRETRDTFIHKMRAEGAIAYDSLANFVLLKVPHPQDVVLQMRRNRIYIRDRSWLPQLDGTVRITVGHRKQMERVFRAFNSMARDRWIFP